MSGSTVRVAAGWLGALGALGMVFSILVGCEAGPVEALDPAPELIPAEAGDPEGAPAEPSEPSSAAAGTGSAAEEGSSCCGAPGCGGSEAKGGGCGCGDKMPGCGG